jgi:hypothetical protein
MKRGTRCKCAKEPGRKGKEAEEGIGEEEEEEEEEELGFKEGEEDWAKRGEVRGVCRCCCCSCCFLFGLNLHLFLLLHRKPLPFFSFLSLSCLLHCPEKLRLHCRYTPVPTLAPEPQFLPSSHSSSSL